MRGLLIALGWIATVAAAFVLGKTRGEGTGDVAPDEALVRAADEIGVVDPGPMLAPGATDAAARLLRDAPAAATSATSDPYALKAGETLEPFTLEGVTQPEEALSRILRHLSVLLAKGEDGHLDLLKFLDEHIVRSEDLERVFEGSEEQMARHIVPMVEFLVHRKPQVVGVIESVFETMAERPELYADIDDDTLEIFTEGGAVVLPGAVGEARLAKARGWVNAILATPEGSLPKPVEKQRRRLGQALMLWAPRLSAEDALRKLRAGELVGPEALPVLQRLSPEQLGDLDLAGILAPALAGGDYRTIRALRNLPLQPRDVDVLDGVLLDAAAAGKVRDWTLANYLGHTGRQAWPAQQALLETGFRRGGRALEVCASALMRIGGPVPPEYLQWVLDTYELSAGTATRLRGRIEDK